MTSNKIKNDNKNKRNKTETVFLIFVFSFFTFIIFSEGQMAQKTETRIKITSNI